MLSSRQHIVRKLRKKNAHTWGKKGRPAFRKIQNHEESDAVQNLMALRTALFRFTVWASLHRYYEDFTFKHHVEYSEGGVFQFLLVAPHVRQRRHHDDPLAQRMPLEISLVNLFRRVRLNQLKGLLSQAASAIWELPVE